MEKHVFLGSDNLGFKSQLCLFFPVCLGEALNLFELTHSLRLVKIK